MTASEPGCALYLRINSAFRESDTYAKAAVNLEN